MHPMDTVTKVGQLIVVLITLKEQALRTPDMHNKSYLIFDLAPLSTNN